jgi:hypothetical protein
MSCTVLRLRDRIVGLREAVRAAAAASGGHDVRLFGAVARGEERDGGDVDFLVRFEPGRTLLDVARLELRLEAMLGRRVNVIVDAGLHTPVRLALLRDVVEV